MVVAAELVGVPTSGSRPAWPSWTATRSSVRPELRCTAKPPRNPWPTCSTRLARRGHRREIWQFIRNASTASLPSWARPVQVPGAGAAHRQPPGRVPAGAWCAGHRVSRRARCPGARQQIELRVRAAQHREAAGQRARDQGLIAAVVLLGRQLQRADSHPGGCAPVRRGHLGTPDVVMTNWRDGTVNFEQRGGVPGLLVRQRRQHRHYQACGAVSAPQREWSLKQLVDRVVGKYVAAGRENGNFRQLLDAGDLRSRAHLRAHPPDLRL